MAQQKNSGKKPQKMTAKQRAERERLAAEREARAEMKKAAADRTKKIFTIVVCVILILALGIPTMALTFLSGA